MNGTIGNTVERHILLPYMDPAVVEKEIGDFVIDRVLRVDATGCVIGLSGGIDSTTTATLIKRAFDGYNADRSRRGKPLELVGYILPSSVNNPADAKDGVAVAERLGIRYGIQSIEPFVKAYEDQIPGAFTRQYDAGNLRSRIRGNILNTFAAIEGKSLAGTGNKDEDFAIGYYTLFGDGAVHFSPISRLSKRLVRQMASHLGWDDYFVKREPTAGLELGQTDFHDLGYSYDLVEIVNEGMQQGIGIGDLATHPEVVAVFGQDLRRYAVFGQAPRFSDSADALSDIVQRHKTALLKAEIVSPPSPQITLEYR